MGLSALTNSLDHILTPASKPVPTAEYNRKLVRDKEIREAGYTSVRLFTMQ